VKERTIEVLGYEVTVRVTETSVSPSRYTGEVGCPMPNCKSHYRSNNCYTAALAVSASRRELKRHLRQRHGILASPPDKPSPLGVSDETVLGQKIQIKIGVAGEPPAFLAEVACPFEDCLSRRTASSHVPGAARSTVKSNLKKHFVLKHWSAIKDK